MFRVIGLIGFIGFKGMIGLKGFIGFRGPMEPGFVRGWPFNPWKSFLEHGFRV